MKEHMSNKKKKYSEKPIIIDADKFRSRDWKSKICTHFSDTLEF